MGGNAHRYILLVLTCVSVCGDSVAIARESMSGREDGFSGLNSGYNGATTDWPRFIECWKAAFHDGDQARISVLDNGPGVNEVDFAQVEKILGLSFPASYRDFISYFKPRPLVERLAPWGDVLIGVYEPAQVARLSEFDPEYIDILERFPIDSPDDEYYRYGIAQDDSSGRTAELKDALVVGKYGDARSELILLHPGRVTLDGEMEASILYNSGEFRAPTFAEIMRQLSYLEVGNHSDQMPPFHQTALVGTCADLVKIDDVWWE